MLIGVAARCTSRRRFPLVIAATLTSHNFQSTATGFSMPSPPYSYLSNNDVDPAVDVNVLEAQLSQAEEQRQEAYELSRKMSVTILKARNAVDRNEDVKPFFLKFEEEYLKHPLMQGEAPRRRLANLSSKMEDYARIRSFHHFLNTSQLEAPPFSISSHIFTDEEYLGGACMGLAQDLQRYGLGRATIRDVESVQAAAALVGDILDFLLQLDFRNGPLRRKYDGTKYSLKALETLLYELAVTAVPSDNAEPARKRAKIEESSQLLPMDALRGIQERMEKRDALRESLIKLCRDDQKAAKQSIFALHRGDPKRARTLLSSCSTNIKTKLLPIVEQEPPLRGGSFGNVLEEYVEGKLFYAWLYGKDDTAAADGTPKKVSGVILRLDEFEIDLQPDEYLGGLCDLTGEVGRYAVQRGTERDVSGVQICLETNANIQLALQSMVGRLPQGIPKKLDQVRRSVEKLERMLYEMSLSEAAGGRNVKSDVEEPATAD